MAMPSSVVIEKPSSVKMDGRSSGIWPLLLCVGTKMIVMAFELRLCRAFLAAKWRPLSIGSTLFDY